MMKIRAVSLARRTFFLRSVDKFVIVFSIELVPFLFFVFHFINQKALRTQKSKNNVVWEMTQWRRRIRSSNSIEKAGRKKDDGPQVAHQ
jgi:hypothetical protein